MEIKRSQKEIEKDLNIYEDKTLKPINEYCGIPYFNKLRWWRNGQLITGIYIWINNYGYYPIGSSLKTANERFWFYADKVFDGINFIDNKNITGIVPINSSRITEPAFFYFVEGVQIKTPVDYAHFYHKYTMIERDKYLDYIQLSQISTHPVINLNFKEKDIKSQNIVKNGIIVEDITHTMLGSDKIYEIKKGNLIKVKLHDYYFNFKKDFYKIEKEDSDSKTILEYMKLSKETDILEQNDDDLLENMLAEEKEQNQIIRDLCEEDFTEPIKDFQQIRAKLFNNFSENSLAIKVIHFIDNAMKDMKEFIN